MVSQGRSHAFESEGAQSPKAILGPFSLKKWEGPSLFLLLYGQKSGGAQAPRAPYIDYGPVFGKTKSMLIESKIKVGPDSMFDVHQANFKSTHLLNKIAFLQYQRNRTV